MTPSYMTSSYEKIGGKRTKKSTFPLASTASVSGRETSYRDIGTTRQPVSRSPFRGTTEGDTGMGRGRIEGPKISLGADDDKYQKFLKEQQDIQNARQMLAARQTERAISDPATALRDYERELRKPNMMQSEYTIGRNLADMKQVLQREKEARQIARGRQGHSSPNDTRNRYQR